MFKDKVLLITGGTGWFANAVLNDFINSDIKQIRIFSRDEKKQEDMRIKFNNKKIKFYIGDVRDSKSVNEAVEGVDYIFHAAALKQVPSCEFYPMQAVNTNILGTSNVLDAAHKYDVKNLVVLSTDKAVYPINAMGMSKGMMEKLMCAKSRLISSNIKSKSKIFCATRYGNVMASRGSVIPLFVSQIKQNKDITITDPSMTRFMMSLQDSVSLVKFAFTNAKSGDIFVQKAPATTILTLAKALQDIFSATNNIKIIGTRHGEKLYETLLTREEMVRAIDMGDYYKVPLDDRDLNYSSYFTNGDVKTSLKEDYNSHNTKILDINETKELLLGLDFIKNELKKG